METRVLSRESEVDEELRRALVDCWVSVTRAGGAAGFPFPDVDRAVVADALDGLLAGLAPTGSRLVHAGPVGWVHLRRNTAPVVAHWGVVEHLQTDPDQRRRGIGTALMRTVHAVARDELGLDHLRLAVRADEGLEEFYRALGWTTVGRWPGALRLSPTDTRDEVLMRLDLG